MPFEKNENTNNLLQVLAKLLNIFRVTSPGKERSEAVDNLIKKNPKFKKEILEGVQQNINKGLGTKPKFDKPLDN